MDLRESEMDQMKKMAEKGRTISLSSYQKSQKSEEKIEVVQNPAFGAPQLDSGGEKERTSSYTQKIRASLAGMARKSISTSFSARLKSASRASSESPPMPAKRMSKTPSFKRAVSWADDKEAGEEGGEEGGGLGGLEEGNIGAEAEAEAEADDRPVSTASTAHSSADSEVELTEVASDDSGSRPNSKRESLQANLNVNNMV
jgi:hypothetical protein